MRTGYSIPPLHATNVFSTRSGTFRVRVAFIRLKPLHRYKGLNSPPMLKSLLQQAQRCYHCGHWAVKYPCMPSTESKRAILKKKAGGQKNVMNDKMPPPRNRGVLDNDPRPLHGMGEAAIQALEQIIGYTFDEMHAKYLESIGGEQAIRTFTTDKVRGDTPEEKIARLVADMMRFLAEFKSTKDVIKAYNIDGLSRSRAIEWKTRHQFFNEMWDQINEERFDAAERALFDRSVNGVEEPIISNGQVVGAKTKYSDDLLKFLLAGNRATIYRKAEEKVRQQIDVEMKVKGGLGIEGLDLKKLSTAELDQLQALLDKAQEPAAP